MTEEDYRELNVNELEMRAEGWDHKKCREPHGGVSGKCHRDSSKAVHQQSFSPLPRPLPPQVINDEKSLNCGCL